MQSSKNIQASVEQETKGTGSDQVTVPPGGSNLLLFNLPACAKWIFGSVLFLAIPVYKRMLRIEGVLEKEVIDMVEIVKKVADVTEKVSSDVAEALPSDSDLKKIVIEVEGEAEVVCVDAEKTETFIHKVDDFKDKSEAWLDKIAEEWELIMPDEGSQKEEKENNLKEDVSKPSDNQENKQ
ncbi:hypothetical protein KFK09_020014 [Dendrobium nobile]|uniref:Uncharacterized protein n=1 Tax=Dendrobium nobile TaxID=94219 RepID=A0A8T3ARQ3_DENNO|nr:hypothetical protein KFK09_020014 [Dendrobium nobile]